MLALDKMLQCKREGVRNKELESDFRLIDEQIRINIRLVNECEQ